MSLNKTEPIGRETQRIDLKSGIITWEQLQDLTEYQEITTWPGCVKAAKECLVDRKLNRLRVAALAIRGCQLKHLAKRGPENKALREQMRIEGLSISLREFSKQVGVGYKTLWNWIEIKTKIIDKLPDKEK